MIAWRNRPLNTLSKIELQMAIEDAMHEMARLRGQTQPNQFFGTFLGGLLAGSFLSVIAFIVGAVLA